MDGLLDAELMGWKRLAELATSALREVAGKLVGSAVIRASPLDLYLGLPEPRPGWTISDARHVIEYLRGLILPGLGALRIHVGPQGHASTLDAIGKVARKIAESQVDLCIVGGVDSYLDPATLDWLYENRQLSGENVRAGFFPGEGAGFLAIASTRALRELRLSSLCTIAGAHAAVETKLIKTDDINVAKALTEAVAGATRGLELPGEVVDSIYCDINGERYRSEEWGFVALKLPYVCRDTTTYDVPAVSWGDVGAASGALFAVLAVQGWQRSYARGPRALLWAGSEAGLRAAVLLQEEPSRGGTRWDR
ncbi:beta-ketoacyl synthase N-terminal-like domain-containing protein [Sorangium sp. So ce388]|uniref:beta-ketoacyl synthase N-terminal-like domain-containing protein n=1 Tax=Sorangium sp. So ce388 TaxID=3133309 RepID=UPI003F5B8430